MTRRVPWTVGLLFGAACAATEPKVKPDDMSAAQHRAEAQHERQLAKEDVARYDPGASRVTALGTPASLDAGVAFPLSVYNPTDAYLSEADRHRAHASQHERAAGTLERFEEGECKRFPERSRVACPLLGPVTKIDDVSHGVRVTFAPGVRVDAVAAHMRCHYAYARSHGFDARVSCPLYMKGIEIKQEGTAAVDLTIGDGAKVDDLRARSREEAVFSAQRKAAP